MTRTRLFVPVIVLGLCGGAAISSCAAGSSVSQATSTGPGTGGAGGAVTSSTTTTTTGTGGSTSSTTTSSTGGAGSTTSSTSSSGTGGTGGGPTDFLEPCQEDSECASGICIQIGDGTKACTISCMLNEGCPSTDFRCAPFTGPNDPNRVCLPRFNDLCKPCKSDQDCWVTHNGTTLFDRAECEKISTGVGANETIEGSFCTTECNDNNLPCPSGYSCKLVAGSVVKHCLKDDQECSCQTWWQDPSTNCSNTTVDGTCSGTRGCSNGTLSDCSAKVPMAEVCNGQDDNCNGTTDEGGNALCSNGGLTCVTATCAGAQGCQMTVNAGFCVIGGSLCVIAGTKNPANQCEGCDPSKSATGWSIRTNQSCDDGAPCTSGETCNAAGQCTGGTATPDSFESNGTVATAKTITTIDDCGNTTGSLTATINGGTDVDWYKFSLNNSSSFCDYGTTVTMKPPANRDYDLLVCVSQSNSFGGSCASGSTSVTPPSGLSGYVCCQSTLGAGVTDTVKIDWGCSNFACSDATGTVYVRVSPKGGSQTPECATGYTLTWVDD